MSTQWANIGEDAGALHALIEQVPGHVALELIDYLWIFPPRRVAAGESVVVVIAGFDDDEARRRVFTLRFTVARNRKGVASVITRFDEHGAAPAPALPRIVQGVLRRLGEDAEAEPREEQIGGDTDRWFELVVALGGRPPAAADDAAAEPQQESTTIPPDEPDAPDAASAGVEPEPDAARDL
jgi:hypothetical protein